MSELGMFLTFVAVLVIGGAWYVVRARAAQRRIKDETERRKATQP